MPVAAGAGAAGPVGGGDGRGSGDTVAGRPARAAGVRGVGDLAAQLGREGVHRLADRRLGDEVEGALGERVDGVGAAGGGERGDDDHRHGPLAAGAQGAQHAEPVQARHREVERERVGAVLAAGGQRLVAVAGGGDDVEALTAESVRQHPAHEPGVVGDDDPMGVRDGARHG